MMSIAMRFLDKNLSLVDVPVEFHIWGMAINYGKLNQVTKPFRHPIRRCEDAIQDLGDERYLLRMDLDSGFNQVYVSDGSRSKLALYGLDGVKYRYTGMPFGPINAPPHVYMHD
jgi:hypothetical protein